MKGGREGGREENRSRFKYGGRLSCNIFCTLPFHALFVLSSHLSRSAFCL